MPSTPPRVDRVLAAQVLRDRRQQQSEAVDGVLVQRLRNSPGEFARWSAVLTNQDSLIAMVDYQCPNEVLLSHNAATREPSRRCGASR